MGFVGRGLRSSLCVAARMHARAAEMWRTPGERGGIFVRPGQKANKSARFHSHSGKK